MPRLAGSPYFIQQVGDRPHTVNGIAIEDVEAGGNDDGFVPINTIQPPNFLDLNINDLVVFASIKVDLSRIFTLYTSREDMNANVMITPEMSTL